MKQEEVIASPLPSQHIVLEGNRAFVRDPELVECGQVAATGPWRRKVHGPFSKLQMFDGMKASDRHLLASVCLSVIV